MIGILIGTLILSLVHALIPNHWLPLIAVARAQRWSEREVFITSLIASTAHVTGTVILGILLGYVGVKLSEAFEESIHLLAPLLLIILGIVYFSINLPHTHEHEVDAVNDNNRKTRNKWILTFVLIMFLSPCLEAVTFFLSAGAYGFNNVLLLSLVYAIGSIISIVTLIMLGFKGVNMIKLDFIEHNEKKISGIVLIIVGLVTFFIH